MAAILENKKAFFDYEILEKFQAGIELSGSEVKSLRLKRGSLEGSRVLIRGSEVYLINMNIPPYQAGNEPLNYDAERTRRLLLSKKEIEQLNSLESKKGLTIIPLTVYNKGRYLKVDIAVARNKKKYDKRDIIKKRESDIEARRTLKGSF